MKARIYAAMAMTTLLAGTAWAALSPAMAEFGKSAARGLMTKEEAAQWKGIQNDQDAQKFIDLFWARRDPTPSTPANEFKETYDEALKYAQEHFSAPGAPGALSDRAKILLLFGSPSRGVHTAAQAASGGGGGFGGSGSPATETWYYEGDKVPAYLNVKDLQFVFEDRRENGDYRLGPSPRTKVGEVVDKAIQHLIVSPQLTTVPDYKAAVAAPVAKPAPVAAAPVVKPAAAPVLALHTDALKAAADQVRTAAKNPLKPAAVTYGQYVTASGDYYVPVQIYVPASAALGDTGLTFFGSVTDETGNVVASYEEAATLTKSKNDSYFDKTLMLTPGKYSGVFGLAKDGVPLTASKIDMPLTAIEKDSSGLSQLILSNDVYPLTVAQKPTDPFAFGGMKIVPKGDHVFTKADDLWYFIEVRNPALDTDGQPKYQVSLDLQGTLPPDKGSKVEKKVKMQLPLSEVALQPLKGVAGHYAMGSSIPLTDFQPGSYTIKVKVIDSVTKKSNTLEDSFKVVDGAK